jgi:hypothetical protein
VVDVGGGCVAVECVAADSEEMGVGGKDEIWPGREKARISEDRSDENTVKKRVGVLSIKQYLPQGTHLVSQITYIDFDGISIKSDFRKYRGREDIEAA